MQAREWRPEYSTTAQAIWQKYEAEHDLSGMAGKVAGVSPITGKVWVGDSGVDITRQMRASGEEPPIFFFRIGQPYFVRKGRR